MKILFVVPAYEPAWAFGGTVTATSQLCQSLVKKGVDVTVYTTNADGKGGNLNVPLNKLIYISNVKVLYFHCNFGIRKAFYSKDLSKKLRDAIKDFDLVHVSAIWQWIQVDVHKICKSFPKPYIISPHGSFSTWPWDRNWVKKKLYWYCFGRKVIKEATAIHFTTEDERVKSFLSVPLLKEIPSYIVPNGILIKKRNIVRNKLDIPDDKFILLSIGRIHKKKGIHFILKALKKLNNKRFLLLIVGQKEDIGYIKYLNRLIDDNNLQDKVIWHEPVARDKVWDYYFSSNLFVLPSYDENFGMVVVEAMACGLPVLISKNVGIWREVQLDNAGIVVNQNIDEITDVLKSIYKDTKTLNKMSQNARKSAENRYDINKTTSLMIKAYEDILAGRQSPELHWQ